MPIWSRIPDLRSPKTVRQRGATADVDLGSYLRELLDAIAAAPSHRGKVVLVTSIENGAGNSTVARSLNLAAVGRGMFSVLIEVRPDGSSGPATNSPAGQSVGDGLRAPKASVGSVNQLFGAGRNDGAPTSDDIRSEFDLIVIDAPSLNQDPHAASLSAHADLAILVVGKRAADVTASNSAKAKLSTFGAPAIGAIVNQADAEPLRRLEVAS